MANWQYTLDLKDIWDDVPDREVEDIDYPKQGKRVAERIRNAAFFAQHKDDLEEIAVEFESVVDVEDSNAATNSLWDWGDQELPTQPGKMQREKCWIKTF